MRICCYLFLKILIYLLFAIIIIKLNLKGSLSALKNSLNSRDNLNNQDKLNSPIQKYFLFANPNFGTKLKINPSLPRLNLQAIITCFTASLFFFMTIFQLNIMNSLNESLLKDFHLNAAQIGRISSIYFYTNMIFLIPAGLIVDKFSNRRVILISVLISLGSILLLAYAKTTWALEASRFFAGLAGSFALLSCIRLACRWFNPRDLGLVIGLTITVGMLGGFTAQVPFTLLINAFGWRIALLCAALIGVFIWIAIFAGVRDCPAGQQQSRTNSTPVPFWPSFKKATTNLQNWLNGLYASALNLPIVLLGAIWGSLYLKQAHQLDEKIAAGIISMLFIGMIIGSPIIGYLSDRWGFRKVPMLGSAIFSFLIILFIIYLPHISVITGILLFFSLGFFISTQALSFPMIAERNPPAITGIATAFASILIMGGGIMQPIFGVLMNLHWNHAILNGVPQYHSADYARALWILPIGFIVAFISGLFIVETHSNNKKIKF